jgi:hypothetical protein
MRAQFGKIHTGYHVLTSNVGVAPTQTVTVPAADGLAYQRPVGAWRTAHGMPTDTIAGVADFGWFVNYILDVMDNLNVGSDVVPIFLTDNVMLYSGSYLGCCTIGFHGTPAMDAATAAAHPAALGQTLMFVAWSTPGTYSGFMTDYTGTRSAPAPTRGIADIHAFSHEGGRAPGRSVREQLRQAVADADRAAVRLHGRARDRRPRRRRLVPAIRQPGRSGRRLQLLRAVPPRGGSLRTVVRSWCAWKPPATTPGTAA